MLFSENFSDLEGGGPELVATSKALADERMIKHPQGPWGWINRNYERAMRSFMCIICFGEVSRRCLNRPVPCFDLLFGIELG